jgi:RasGEF domain/RasGEF N-terminal motif
MKKSFLKRDKGKGKSDKKRRSRSPSSSASSMITSHGQTSGDDASEPSGGAQRHDHDDDKNNVVSNPLFKSPLLPSSPSAVSVRHSTTSPAELSSIVQSRGSSQTENWDDFDVDSISTSTSSGHTSNVRYATLSHAPGKDSIRNTSPSAIAYDFNSDGSDVSGAESSSEHIYAGVGILTASDRVQLRSGASSADIGSRAHVGAGGSRSGPLNAADRVDTAPLEAEPLAARLSPPPSSSAAASMSLVDRLRLPPSLAQRIDSYLAKQKRRQRSRNGDGAASSMPRRRRRCGSLSFNHSWDYTLDAEGGNEAAVADEADNLLLAAAADSGLLRPANLLPTALSGKSPHSVRYAPLSVRTSASSPNVVLLRMQADGNSLDQLVIDRGHGVDLASLLVARRSVASNASPLRPSNASAPSVDAAGEASRPKKKKKEKKERRSGKEKESGESAASLATDASLASNSAPAATVGGGKSGSARRSSSKERTVGGARLLKRTGSKRKKSLSPSTGRHMAAANASPGVKFRDDDVVIDADTAGESATAGGGRSRSQTIGFDLDDDVSGGEPLRVSTSGDKVKGAAKCKEAMAQVTIADAGRSHSGDSTMWATLASPAAHPQLMSGSPKPSSRRRGSHKSGGSHIRRRSGDSSSPAVSKRRRSKSTSKHHSRTLEVAVPSASSAHEMPVRRHRDLDDGDAGASVQRSVSSPSSALNSTRRRPRASAPADAVDVAESSKDGVQEFAASAARSFELFERLCKLHEKAADAKRHEEELGRQQRDQRRQANQQESLVVEAGTVDALVLCLVELYRPDWDYINAFLATFRSFMSAERLFDMLAARYDFAPSKSASSAQVSTHAKWAKQVQLRVFQVLERWLADYGLDDFECADQRLRHRAIAFLQRIVASGEQKFELSERANRVMHACKPFVSGGGQMAGMLYAKQMTWSDDALQALVDLLAKSSSAAAAASASSSSSSLSLAGVLRFLRDSLGYGPWECSECCALLKQRGFVESSGTALRLATDGRDSPTHMLARGSESILDLSMSDLARQLTVRDMVQFSGIRAAELVNRRWLKDDGVLRSRHIVKMAADANELTFWLITEIVTELHPDRRKAVLRRVLELANYLHDLSSYNSLFAVVSALETNVVSRIRSTWAQLDLKRYRAVLKLTSPRRNYAVYRSVMRTQAKPCVPYAGIYTRDLQLIDEANVARVPNRRRRNGTAKGNDGDGEIDDDDDDDDDDDCELTNFERCRMAAAVIMQLRSFQSSKYSFAPIARYVKLLSNLMAISDEDTLYQFSLKCEPLRAAASSPTPTK